MPALPNITAVNALGDYDIEADRLAIIEAEGTWRFLIAAAVIPLSLDVPRF